MVFEGSSPRKPRIPGTPLQSSFTVINPVSVQFWVKGSICGTGVTRGVGVFVGVDVGVDVEVAVAVAVAVAVFVGVDEGVPATVAVAVGVAVDVEVGVGVPPAVPGVIAIPRKAVFVAAVAMLAKVPVMVAL